MFHRAKHQKRFRGYLLFSEQIIVRATRFSNNLLDRTGIRQWTLEIVIEEVLWSIRGSYQAIRRSSLMNAKWHSLAWPNTMTNLQWSNCIPIHDLFTEHDLLPTYERFQYIICDGCSMLTGDTYSSGHVVPSDLGLSYVLLVDTDPFPELVVIFPDHSLRTSLQLVLSRFCCTSSWSNVQIKL